MSVRKLEAVVALTVVFGALFIILLLSFVTIPEANEKTVDGIVTAWLTVGFAWLTVGFAYVMKKLFDGSRSGDEKNEIMANQAVALAAKANDAPRSEPGSPA